MADTTFVNGTVIEAAWLNDVNDHVYATGNVVYASSLTGIDITGATDNTTILQAAIDTGARLVLDGTFLISSPLEPTQAGVIGQGPELSKIICNGCHAFQFPADAGFDRTACLIQGLSIDSNNGTSCDAKYAFYAPGVGSGASAVYNSGITIKDIEIGRDNRMGGGFYMKDVFRLNVENIGLTSVSMMISLVGSVVQAKFYKVTSNNDDPGTALNKYGIHTEIATYASGQLGPENCRFMDCSYIRGTRGINHTTGFGVTFQNFDTEVSEYGALLNAPCTLTGGVIGPDTDANVWTGIFRGVNIATVDDATFIDNVDVNAFREPATPASSYGIDLGDGVSPVYGLVVKNCRIRGVANSMQSGIRGRELFDANISDNYFKTSAIISTDIAITGFRRLVLEHNHLPSGTITVNDNSATDAYSSIIGNQATSLTTTLTTADNHTISNNEPSGVLPRRLLAEVTSTFVGTYTGMTGSVTGTIRYVLQGRQVTLYLPATTGTSNTTAMTITGMPSSLYPNREQNMWGLVVDNGSTTLGAIRVSTGGTISAFVGASLANFTGSGTKGTAAATVTYSLD